MLTTPVPCPTTPKSHRIMPPAISAATATIFPRLQARDVNEQPVFSYGHIERTYSEWQLSDYADPNNKGACQSRHYLTVPGGGKQDQ